MEGRGEKRTYGWRGGRRIRKKGKRESGKYKG